MTRNSHLEREDIKTPSDISALDMTRIFRDPKDIEENVDFSRVLDQANRESDAFTEAHRVTNDLMKIEFCI